MRAGVGAEQGPERVGIKVDQQIGLCCSPSWSSTSSRSTPPLRLPAPEPRPPLQEKSRTDGALTAMNREIAAKRARSRKQDELQELRLHGDADLKSTAQRDRLIGTCSCSGTGGRSVPRAARTSAHRATRGGTEDMIRDLLELFKITSSPRPPRGWSSHAGRTCSRDPAAADRREGRQVEVGSLPRSGGSRESSSHVVTNLLSNAPQDVARRPRSVEVSGVVGNGHVLLSICDNGIGISPPTSAASSTCSAGAGTGQVVRRQPVGAPGSAWRSSSASSRRTAGGVSWSPSRVVGAASRALPAGRGC